MNMEERLQAVVAQAEMDGNLWHAIIHGDSTTTVPIENGNVPSAAKQMADVRAEVISNVTDYLGQCRDARDTAIQTKQEIIVLNEQGENIKAETLALRNEAEGFKNQSQQTFNTIATTTNTSISTIQTEGATQITLVQSAVAEQVAEATNQANRAEQVTNSKLNIDLTNATSAFKEGIIHMSMPDYTSAIGMGSPYTAPCAGIVIFELPARMVGSITIGGDSHSFSYSYNYTQNTLASYTVAKGQVISFSGCSGRFFPCNAGVL